MTVNGLVLVDVHVGDTGNYTCKAESILGVQEKVVELIVKGIVDSYLLVFILCEMGSIFANICHTFCYEPSPFFLFDSIILTDGKPKIHPDQEYIGAKASTRLHFFVNNL